MTPMIDNRLRLLSINTYPQTSYIPLKTKWIFSSFKLDLHCHLVNGKVIYQFAMPRFGHKIRIFSGCARHSLLILPKIFFTVEACGEKKIRSAQAHFSGQRRG